MGLVFVVPRALGWGSGRTSFRTRSLNWIGFGRRVFEAYSGRKSPFVLPRRPGWILLGGRFRAHASGGATSWLCRR
jgi:hypothetical protein